MLIISRRSKEKLSFPQVGITVHFLRIQSGQAKVGVEAPPEIKILREELADSQEIGVLRRHLLRLPKEVRHSIRNELNEISVGMHLFKELVSSGMLTEAEETFESIRQAIKRLDDNEALRRQDTTPTERTGSRSVVVVEDVANEREMLAAFLRMRGYNVVCFEDGTEAIEYLNNHVPPRFVLVDMKLTNKHGSDVVRELRNLNGEDPIKVYAVSGTSPQENGLDFGEKGVDQWFPKPLNPAYLIEVMDSMAS